MLRTMALELRPLEVFCRVVERRSFTLAGRDLGLAQASVSERVAALEATVGVRLLDRLGRDVVPTRAGLRLYEKSQQLLQFRDEMLDEIASFDTPDQGTLEVAASTIPGEYRLPGVVARFRGERPGVFVRVQVGDSEWVAERVLAGDAELGIVGTEPESPLLQATPLWPDALVAIAPPGHPLAGPQPISREQLVQAPVVLREPGSGTRRTLELALGPTATAMLQPVAEFGSTTAVKRAVAAGLGVAVVSAAAVEEELAAGTLQNLNLRPPLPIRRLWAVTDRRRATSGPCRVFLEFLQADAGDGRRPNPART